MRFELEDVVFGASNTLPLAGNTRIEMRIFDPYDRKSDDRSKIEGFLSSRPDTLRELAYRNLTFGRAGEVVLEYALGPERVLVEDYDQILDVDDGRKRPPIDVLGVVSRDTSNEVLTQQRPFAAYKGPLMIELRPGEVQQVFVRLNLRDSSLKGAFVLLIDHSLGDKQIGSLVYVLMTPHNPFRPERKSSPPGPRASK